MTAELRDSRAAGSALRVDLMDRGAETGLWSDSDLIVKIPPGRYAEGDRVTGVFTFGGEVGHGLFEARIAELDRQRDRMGAALEWINPPGRILLESIAARRRPGEHNNHPKMTLGFAHIPRDWSLSGFLLADYDGPLETGQRVSGMIWMNRPEDPGLFEARAILVDRARRLLSVEFEPLPSNTLALLEAVIRTGSHELRGSPE